MTDPRPFAGSGAACAETGINKLAKLIKIIALRTIVLPRRRAAMASIATGDTETIRLSFDMAPGVSAPVNC